MKGATRLFQGMAYRSVVALRLALGERLPVVSSIQVFVAKALEHETPKSLVGKS
jgi:hypothetical protein